MSTLIVPCAGRSSRFPGMKPKWLLTHPDGQLMIQKAVMGLNLEIFDRIIVTIVREHAELFDAELILKQVFKDIPKVEVLVLEGFTNCSSETIYRTILGKNVDGPFVVKDSDNCVHVTLPVEIRNCVVGYDLQKHPNISNIPGKSFVVVNDQNILQDIIEKKVVSNVICLGVYCFASTDLFKSAYLKLVHQGIEGEMFVSHVISYVLSRNSELFEVIMADGYDDWGTFAEWREVQERNRTYFVDFDGVIMKNSGAYGRINWLNNRKIIQENIDKLIALQKQGAQLVITTSRPEGFRDGLERLLSERGLRVHALVMGLNHAARVLINDFAPTNPYPSCLAISVPRDGSIEDYL